MVMMVMMIGMGFDQFDTSTLTADLLGPDQNLDDYEISFLYTDEDGNLLSALS